MELVAKAIKENREAYKVAMKALTEIESTGGRRMLTFDLKFYNRYRLEQALARDLEIEGNIYKYKGLEEDEKYVSYPYSHRGTLFFIVVPKKSFDDMFDTVIDVDFMSVFKSDLAKEKLTELYGDIFLNHVRNMSDEDTKTIRKTRTIIKGDLEVE